MIDAIQRFERLVPSGGYPPTILAEFGRSHSRLLAKIAAGDWAGYGGLDDRLWKDLGIARQRLVPVSAWVANVGAGYSRGFAFAAGPRQFIAALPYLKSNRNWVTCHLNMFEKHRFNEAGFREMVRLVADLLKARPAVSGLFLGASWLYSPQLPLISPHLDFHRRIVLPAGGAIFFSRKGGPDSMALRASETRRRAYLEGRYDPDDYLLIWPRDKLIAWADAQAA
jgi:hypothetical protein